MDRNFLIVGVGGQGALLASNVIAEVGVQTGHHVKKAEVHGMSQRGGSVNSHVRWGKKVMSPVIAEGEVDILFSLEKLETLRYLKMVRKESVILIGEFKIPPLSVSSGIDSYPSDEEILKSVRQVTRNYHFITTLSFAEKVGSIRVHNVVLLGSLSARIDDIPLDTWLQVIESRVPKKTIPMNREAFLLGREAVNR